MTDDGVRAAAANLRQAALALADIEQTTGVLIHLDLEPEPGCRLQRAADVVSLFDRYLLTGTDDDVILRHLRVCHDLCHAAVMFEDQAAMPAAHDSAGGAVISCPRPRTSRRVELIRCTLWGWWLSLRVVGFFHFGAGRGCRPAFPGRCRR